MKSQTKIPYVEPIDLDHQNAAENQERSPVPPSKYRLGGGTGWCENHVLRPDFLGEIGDMVGEKHGKPESESVFFCTMGIPNGWVISWKIDLTWFNMDDLG